MTSLLWYRQKRVDGGIRTGVEVDDETVLGLVQDIPDEPDPVLAWYVDLRCEGAKLPTKPEEVRRWLIEQAPVIRAGLAAVAAELSAGMDADIWPLQRPLAKAPRGVKMRLVCAATRRVHGRGLAGVLTDIGRHWEEWVLALAVGRAAAYE
jgi:hypothetical protein